MPLAHVRCHPLSRITTSINNAPPLTSMGCHPLSRDTPSSLYMHIHPCHPPPFSLYKRTSLSSFRNCDNYVFTFSEIANTTPPLLCPTTLHVFVVYMYFALPSLATTLLFFFWPTHCPLKNKQAAWDTHPDQHESIYLCNTRKNLSTQQTSNMNHLCFCPLPLLLSSPSFAFHMFISSLHHEIKS